MVATESMTQLCPMYSHTNYGMEVTVHEVIYVKKKGGGEQQKAAIQAKLFTARNHFHPSTANRQKVLVMLLLQRLTHSSPQTSPSHPLPSRNDNLKGNI